MGKRKKVGNRSVHVWSEQDMASALAARSAITEKHIVSAMGVDTQAGGSVRCVLVRKGPAGEMLGQVTFGGVNLSDAQFAALASSAAEVLSSSLSEISGASAVTASPRADLAEQRAKYLRGELSNAERIRFFAAVKASGITPRRTRAPFSSRFITCTCGALEKDACACIRLVLADSPDAGGPRREA